MKKWLNMIKKIIIVTFLITLLINSIIPISCSQINNNIIKTQTTDNDHYVLLFAHVKGHFKEGTFLYWPGTSVIKGGTASDDIVIRPIFKIFTKFLPEGKDNWEDYELLYEFSFNEVNKETREISGFVGMLVVIWELP